MQRKTISPKVRFQILNRDNFECKYCWLKAGNGIQLQVDHIVPVSKWWTSDINNLITSCFECNIGKWKKQIENSESELYKIKLDQNVKKWIDTFFAIWNEAWFWVVDKKTITLLTIFLKEELCFDEYKSMIEQALFYSKREELHTWWLVETVKWKDIDYLLNEFKRWSEFCDEVIYYNGCFFSNNDKLSTFSCYDNNILNDDIWQWKCKDSMNHRLNYFLSERLYDFYTDGRLKNPSVIVKYSYFYNQIANV